MFEEKNPLPGSKLQSSFRDRDHLTGSGQSHSDVRGRIVRTFGFVREVAGVFRDEALEIRLEIDPGGTISIFENDKACARVLKEDRGGACADAASGHDFVQLLGNFVSTFPARWNDERFGMHLHAIRRTLPRELIERQKSNMLSTPSFLSALILLNCFSPLALAAEPEFRAAWVATVHNIDWPSAAGLPAATQKAQLRAILDRAAELRLNAILLQVRPASDALYTSSHEPWSEFLTGKQGVAPGYDPLEFAIGEAHARGIELHAWINPFRAAINAKVNLVGSHIAKKHPEWVRRFGTQLWLDPGEPNAREYVEGIIADIVRRYDVDGVHIDDYFYPYPVKGESFPDDATWERYGSRSGLNRGDWRRENIDDFVRAMYRTVKATKGSVRVGISPFGIWRPGVPPTIEAQLDAYAQLFADSRKWLAEGWCDYMAPQLYWGIQPAKQSFPVLLDWWRAQSHGKPIWPGIATERVGAARPAREIVDQITLTRRGTDSPGHIHWSMKSLMQNRGGVADLLRRGPYADRAQIED